MLDEGLFLAKKGMWILTLGQMFHDLYEVATSQLVTHMCIQLIKIESELFPNSLDSFILVGWVE